jgi:dTMP kinase
MPYIIFEGPDGVGKSTIIDKITSLLINKYNVYKTQLPGYTPLGKHLRKLVKTPQQINPEITDIDPHTRQLLYAADYSAYAHWLNTVPQPNRCILADRCSAISSLIYG